MTQIQQNFNKRKRPRCNQISND